MLVEKEILKSNNKCKCLVCGSDHVFNKKLQWCKPCYDLDYNKKRSHRGIRPIQPRVNPRSIFKSNFLQRIKYQAKHESKTFDLDEKWIEGRLKNGVCEVTNVEFSIHTKRLTGYSRYFTPAIDLVDESLGYTQDNCRVVVEFYKLSKAAS